MMIQRRRKLERKVGAESKVHG